jgi:hypothetical protein
MPRIVAVSDVPSDADRPGVRRARLIDKGSGVGGMSLERVSVEPGARGPEVVGGGGERFLYVIMGSGRAGELPLAPETMVWIEPGDRLPLVAGDEGLEVLVAGASARADR